MLSEVDDYMHWTASHGKNWLPFGLVAYEALTLGIMAVGVGLQAYAGSKQPDQPRETEQERQIKRQSEGMRAIREMRVNRQSVMGPPILKLINTATSSISERRVTETGREVLKRGMEPIDSDRSKRSFSFERREPTENIPAQTPGPRPTLTATSTPTVTPTPTPTPTPGTPIGEAQGRRDPINLHGDPRLTQIQNILDTTQPAEEPARRVPVGEDWRGGKIGEAERNLREAAKRKLRRGNT